MNHDEVVIDAAKVRDYLLSTSHPVGRFMVAEVTTVWIVLHGESTIRFVTAYPGTFK